MDLKIWPLFACPVVLTEVDFLNDDLIKSIKELEYERTYDDDGWRTVEKNILCTEKFAKLKADIDGIFNFYKDTVVEVSDTFKMCASWGIKHSRGDWAPIHRHDNSLFSGVLYLDVDENSGNFGFHNAQSVGINTTFSFNVKSWNIYNSKQFIFTPKKGEMLIFPSSLHHYVTPSKSDCERTIVSFNYFLDEYSCDNNACQINLKQI